jgi:hypothetical protein
MPADALRRFLADADGLAFLAERLVLRIPSFDRSKYVIIRPATAQPDAVMIGCRFTKVDESVRI